MKIYGPELYKVRISEEGITFPEVAKEGDLAYVSNEFYIYTIDGAKSYWQKMTADKITEMSDVSITNIQDKQCLVWNAIESKFVNISLSTLFLSLSGGIISGNIIPNIPKTLSLGTSANPFLEIHAEHGYFGANSLYINGKKVISDNADQIYISTDPEQDLILKTTGGGDLRFEAGNTVDVLAPGGLILNIPNSQLNKDISVTNNSISGDVDVITNGSNGTIGITTYGQNGSIQIESGKEVDIIAPSIYLLGNAYLNGELLGSNKISINKNNVNVTSNAKTLNFSNDFGVSLGADQSIVNITNNKQYFINTLSDVSINTLSNSDLLVYNTTTSKWENNPLSNILIKDLSIFQGRNSSAITLTTSWQNINLPSIDISNDINTLSINSLDNTQVLIKSSGYYFIRFDTETSPSGATRQTSLRVYKNNSSVINGSLITVNTYSGEVHDVSSESVAYLNAGDYLQFQVLSNSTPSSLPSGASVIVYRMNGIKGDKGDRGEPGSAGATSISIQKDSLTILNTTDTLNFSGNVSVTRLPNTNTVNVQVTNPTNIYIPKIMQVYNSVGGVDLNVTSPIVVPFNVESFKDDCYLHDNTSNNSRIYVSKSGLYKVTYNISFRTTANSQRVVKCYARKNGSVTLIPSESYDFVYNTANDNGTCTASFITQLSINEYIEILGIREGAAGSVATIANACWCLIELIREV